MACVADELRQTILGGRVQKIVLPDMLSVGLEIYAHQQRHHLLASAHAEQARLHLASEKLRRGVEKETGLLLLLRKYARGAAVSAVEVPPSERILRLELDHPEWGCTELVIELMGRHSNIMLVGAGNRVLDAVKRVGLHMSPTRPIQPGQPYTPPPPQAKLPPPELTEYRLRQILDRGEDGTQVWRLLVQGLGGFSPLLAREVAYRSLGHPRAQVSDVEHLTPMLDIIRDLLAPLGSAEWQPCVVRDGGQPVVYAPYPITHRGDPVAMPLMSQAIEAYTAAVASVDPYAAPRRSVQEAITSARSRLERRRESLERSLNQAAEADKWRQWGEWILTFAYAITPGQKELVAEPGDGQVLLIPLDPNKAPAENAQDYFTRYRKAQRAAKGGPARLRRVKLELLDLSQLDTDLALAANRPEIDAVRAVLAEAGYTRARARGVRKTARSKPLSLISPDGMTIIVGRNSRQNDEVTFRLAKRDDWWFHVRGMPGAHIIVRAEGKVIPPSTIQRAAELSAYFSGMRDESGADVDYTRRRHVRRIRGAAPGLVTYKNEQTIRVTPRGPDLSLAEAAE
jgi:predicted ribosome quality control (RQC) complex YloA/Tae2 family protein